MTYESIIRALVIARDRAGVVKHRIVDLSTTPRSSINTQCIDCYQTCLLSALMGNSSKTAIYCHFEQSIL